MRLNPTADRSRAGAENGLLQQQLSRHREPLAQEAKGHDDQNGGDGGLGHSVGEENDGAAVIVVATRIFFAVQPMMQIGAGGKNC